MLIAGFYAAVSHAADPDGSRMAEPWWRERFAAKQQALHQQPVRLLLLGDSIFQSFEWDPKAPEWDHWYGGRDAVDLGFNGDGWQNVLWRLRHGELDGISLRLIVILIGTNDLWQPPEQIAHGIGEIVQTIRARTPNTRVLLLGILPSGKPAQQQADARAVNARLAAMYGHTAGPVRYDDVSCVFLRHGALNESLFREAPVPGVSAPLHPTLHGMDLLAARIEPIVSKALGDQDRAAPDALDGTDCQPGG